MYELTTYTNNTEASSATTNK